MRVLARTSCGRALAAAVLAAVLGLGGVARATETGATRGDDTEAPAAKSADEAKSSRARTPKPLKRYGNLWYRDAASAVAAAQRARKPILLLRMLGELDGKT